MGCCFSNSDSKSQAGEPNERTTLLGNPVSNTTNRPLYNENFGTEYEVARNHMVDELDALNKILHQTTCNIIDVSAISPHLEQKEYLDRARLYQQKLSTLQLGPIVKDSPPLLRDLPYPEKVLASNPLSSADIKMMQDSFLLVSAALQDIKVEHKEDLVAHFGT